MAREIKDKYIAFEVSIEPKFVTGEGRGFDKWRSINMSIYARDINEAIATAKEIVNCNAADIEVVSATMAGYAAHKGF